VSGKASEKRRHAMSAIAADLAEKGLTHRQIAEQLGIEAERVKSYIVLGQRLRQKETVQ
jgi:predicted transcriptional regulator